MSSYRKLLARAGSRHMEMAAVATYTYTSADSLTAEEMPRCFVSQALVKALSANLDLMPCASLPVFGEHILGVGWLDKFSNFPTGPTSSEVFARLLEFVRNPWQPFVAMGVHECEICQFQGEAVGGANLYIPFNGKIYVCPELITHYINAHSYSPPSIFCDAVLACPPMNSMEFKRLLLAYNGQVLWKPSSEWREL